MTRHAPRTSRTGISRQLLATLFTLLFWPLMVSAESVTLNLKNADIRDVIVTIAELTGRSFLIDPKVQGKVTITGTQPMDPDQLYALFLSVLEMHGLAAVDSGKVTKIVPAAIARSRATPLLERPARLNGDNSVTRVLQLNNVRAAELVPLLRPLLPQESHLAAHNASNTLITTGSAVNLDRLYQIIRRIDLDTDTDIEIIRLEHASASEVAKMLAALQAKRAQKPGGSTAELAQIVPDQRTNSIILSGAHSQRLKIRTLIAHLDTPLESNGTLRVIYLRYAKATEIAKLLQGIVAAGQKGAADAPPNRPKVMIQAHENTNALVIDAGPERFAELEAVIRKLDIRRAQVLIEAVIAEISAEKSAELGLQWRAMRDATDRGFIGGTSFSTSQQGINQLSANPLALGDGISVGFLNGTIDVLGSKMLNLSFLLRALSVDSDANILATPTLVTMDNETAEIIIAKNVPFLTGQYSNQGSQNPGVNPFQTIERRDIGLKLTVTPQINEGDAVLLDIYQEVSNLSPSSDTGAIDLVTVHRSIRTRVIVNDKEIVVLGGLIDENLQKGVGKVPILGDLPIIGNLFRYQTSKAVKRNLMIFLRPEIIRDNLTSRRISLGKYNMIREHQLEVQPVEELIMPNFPTPVLPELDAQ